MNIMWRAILTAIVLTPTYLIRFHIFGFPTTVFEIIILALAAATCVHASYYPSVRRAYKEKFLSLSPVFVGACGAFIIAGGISVFVAPDIRAALGIWRAYIIEAILFGIVVWLNLEHEEQLREIAIALSITTFIVAAYAVVQKFTGWGIPNPFWRAAATRRVTSFFGYPNAVGLYVELTIPFLIALAVITKKRALRLWCLCVALLAAAAFIFAGSSGTFAALCVAAGALGVFARRTRWWTIAFAIIFAAVIVVSPYRQKFADEFLLQGFSGRLRTQMWKETVVMLKERPFQGAGLAGYQARVKPYHVFKWAEIYLYPHNLVLTLWSELGALGVISFVMIFILLARWLTEAYCSKRSATYHIWASALIAELIIISVHGLVDIPYFKNDLSALFWLLVAIVLWLRYSRSSLEN